ncbi:hypothetical protein BGZ83_005909 [Gryganskiella cystojenkinii]|nr:hypothetical protein BGZ83_005909 [Gryganskiella cystojenkinii]
MELNASISNTTSSSSAPTSTTNNNRRKLFDPKHDPVPVVPSSQSRSGSGPGPNGETTRNKEARVQKQRSPQSSTGRGQPQPHQQLWQPQPQQQQQQRQQESSVVTNSNAATANAPSSSSSIAASSSSSPQTPRPDNGLVRLTKEIQQLEKKVMEKPGRRSLDSDEDDPESRYGQGHLFWNRRTENAKRLASKYLKLLELDFKSSLKHDIDTRCWKLAIYPLIETFRAALRNAEHTNGGMSSSGSMSLSESDEDHTSTIRHCFSEFISFAQEFYVVLQSTLQTLEANGTMRPVVNGRPIPPRWHRCIGILGDLARYRWLHKLDEFSTATPTDWLIVARKFYREAIDLGPGNGKMYNQLALLSGGQDLEALYYYSKSLTVKSSFMNARDTLMSFFAANEHIQNLTGLSLKPNSKSRQAALIANATLQDCEGTFLLLHAMLFEKINLDKFEKRLRNFSKQIRSLQQRQQQSQLGSPRSQQDAFYVSDSAPPAERWDGFYFMQAVINIAAMYEFNWSGSVIAKATIGTGSVTDLLDSVATLPYSSKLLLSTMEQTMRNYMSTVAEDNQKKVAQSSVVQDQQLGWLVYCDVVLTWMASRPFGTTRGEDMLENWLTLADQESLPDFWSTLTEFMNLHWNRLSPFEQSDMLSTLSDEISEQVTSEHESSSPQQHRQDTTGSMFKLSTPPLGHEWELRGLAWIPEARFGSQMFKGSQPVLQDDELKGDCLWTRDSIKTEHLSRRIVELSHIAAMNMAVIEFDFCDNAFKVNEDYAAQVQELMAAKAHLPPVLAVVSDDYSTDEKSFTFSHDESSALEDEEDETALFSSDGLDFGDRLSTSEILELKSKRDQLKSLLSESNANGRMSVSLGSLQREYKPRSASSSAVYAGNSEHGNSNGRGRRSQNRAYTDRRQGGDHSQRATTNVTENSILVIDTNCLVADWTLIQRLVNADRWTVIVPLAVITELDGLKNNPPPLGPAAASALTYLETSLAMRPKPRRLKIQTSRGNYMNDLSFRVESFNYDKQQQQQQQQQLPKQHRRTASSGGDDDDTDDMYQDQDEEIMRNHNVDDFILGLCLWHQNKKPSTSTTASSSSSGLPAAQPGIYLVTDDRNLRVKARARNMDVLGKDDIGRMTRQQRQ